MRKLQVGEKAFVFPLLLARKYNPIDHTPTGWRVCIDLRALNKVLQTEQEHEPTNVG